MKAFIIHHPSEKIREPLVEALVKATNATIVEPVWLPFDPVRGCRESHQKILALNPEEPCLIFEDDCEIVREDFLSLLEDHKDCDLIYLGVSDYSKSPHHHPIPIVQSYGTHAYYVNPKARQTILERLPIELTRPYQDNRHPYDQLLNVIEVEQNLKVWKPKLSVCNDYVQQKPGLFSSISKTIRWKLPGGNGLPCYDAFLRAHQAQIQRTQSVGQGQVLQVSETLSTPSTNLQV
jgi:hypothetical protein